MDPNQIGTTVTVEVAFSKESIGVGLVDRQRWSVTQYISAAAIAQQLGGGARRLLLVRSRAAEARVGDKRIPPDVRTSVAIKITDNRNVTGQIVVYTGKVGRAGCSTARAREAPKDTRACA